MGGTKTIADSECKRISPNFADAMNKNTRLGATKRKRGG